MKIKIYEGDGGGGRGEKKERNWEIREESESSRG